MEIAVLILMVVLIGGVGLLYTKLQKNSPDFSNEKEQNALLKQENSRLEQKIGELQSQLATEKTTKDSLSGENKRMYVEIQNLKKDLQVSEEQNSGFKQELTKFKSKADQKEVEFKDQINKLQSAQKSLEDEQIRVRKEDIERDEKEKQERDRMWNEHENDAIRQLGEICKTPEYSFQYYDNTHLPEDFDGKLKPDFMIDFLGQYMIFDAKTSRSENLQLYIDGAVKDTVNKIKDSPSIHKTIYFVVPTDAVQTLKKFHYYEQGYTFFVVSKEALMPVIASLKRITSYEFAEKLDPQERENIVNLVAEFDNHIRFRNAADILLAQSGINILDKASQLAPSLEDDVQNRKSKMRLTNLKPNDIKRLMLSTENQHRDIKTIISPKADITDEVIETASEIIKD